MADVLSFWGKARPLAHSAHDWHPVACHGLDVAAVAEALLARHGAAVARIAAAGGWKTQDLVRVVVFLIALHDIGKFSRVFQALAPEHWPEGLQGKPEVIPGQRHDVLGYAMLLDDESILAVLLKVFDGWEKSDIKLLLGAVASHHGRPVLEGGIREGAVCGRCWEAARGFVFAALSLLQPPTLPPPAPGAAARISWWLAGLTTLCDWIGSSSAWFPYVGGRYKSLADYWPVAQSQAARALKASGILPVAPAAPCGFTGLFPRITAPTPMQRLAAEAPLPEGPICVIIEDATGSGKTEAAVMLTHRLIAQSRAEGLFVALPTMATADAMFSRLAESYRALFAEEADPSLALAHGRALLDPLFRGSILPAARTAPEDEPADETETASAQCASWLAEERRRVFFAHVGVGTIDQALLSVLPARYAPLRLLGLSGKVLLIDEAHAYDTYMGAELDRLLTFHAVQGGSAIILSATLPQARRAGLLAAFAQGLGASPFPPVCTDFPLMTIAGSGSGVEYKAAMRDELRRTLPVRRLASMGAAVAALAAAAQAGACCIWVRNTVDDAIAGAEALRALGLKPILFHARFAMGDRLAIQQNVLSWFGKDSRPDDRAPDGVGRVLVATQVVEQSLDLDADVMVTDLAPVDLLIQRAGRLQRHPRRGRPPGFEKAELLVVSPEPVAEPDANWAADAAIGGTRFVYPVPILWGSARALWTAKQIVVPDGVRGLVEAVYGPDQAEVPPGLSKAETKLRGKREAEQGLARINLLEAGRGYGFHNGEWALDIIMPTRLGDDARIFRMARVEGGALIPFCADPEPERAWALSEIALRKSLVDELAVPPGLLPALAKLRAGWPKWQREIPVLVMLPSGPCTWTVDALFQNRTVSLCYSPSLGLERIRADA